MLERPWGWEDEMDSTGCRQRLGALPIRLGKGTVSEG